MLNYLKTHDLKTVIINNLKKKIMLLDLELKIKITNNGKENNVDLIVNSKHKIIDSLTALELAKKNITNIIEIYITEKYGTISESKFDEIIKTITLEEMIG